MSGEGKDDQDAHFLGPKYKVIGGIDYHSHTRLEAHR